MFIDTDTVADSRGLVGRALREATNNLRSDIQAHKNGNTSIVPKSQLRRKAIVLEGYLAVYNVVYHYGDAEGFDYRLIDNAQAARREVAAMYGKDSL